MIKLNYNIIHAYRNLKKSPIYSFLTIAGLTIGLSVFLFISLFVYNETTVDKCYPNHDRIYRLINASNNNCGIDYNFGETLHQKYPEIAENCMMLKSDYPTILKTKANGLYFDVSISTTNEFFNFFGIKVLSKLNQKPFSDYQSIILTQSTAEKLFGQDNPLGQQVNFDNDYDLTVSAIVADFPENSSINADFLVNAEDEEMRFSTQCNKGVCYNPVDHYILLQPNVNENDFIAQLNQTAGEYQTRIEKFSLQPLTDIYLSKNIEGNSNKLGNPTYLKIISIVGLIILLLSIINYINFSLSLQHSRLKEISIKKINGAGLKQLLIYHLWESSLTVIIVSFLSVVILIPLSHFSIGIFGKSINLSLLFSPALTSIFIIVIFIILVINSLIHVLMSGRVKIIDGVQSKIMNLGKSKIRKIFTTIQFAASIALLISVLFIVKQLNFIDSRDLGFNQKNLLKIEFPYWEAQQCNKLKQEINKLSFIESSAFSNGSPGTVNLSMGKNGGDENFMLKAMLIDSCFLNTFGIKTIEGRSFLGSDYNVACVINELAYKKYGWDNLEGKKFINWRDGGLSVVAVVQNFTISSFHNDLEPVCLMLENKGYNTLSVRLTPGLLNQQISQLKKTWDKIAVNEPFEFKFYDAYFNSLYKKEQQLAKSVSLLTLIAFLLTCMGLLGQIIQTCNSKIKEIGIRKVNGAKIFEILVMLNKDFVKWVTIAFVIATPIAYYAMNKWLESFAYKTELSWWIFALAGLLALGIALLTVSWQSWRAATRNPVESLRSE